MNGLSASGLADLAGTTTVEVRRLVELGILVARDGPDPFLDLVSGRSRRFLAEGRAAGTYMVAWTGWVPPVTVSSPSRKDARQAAPTVRGWKSAPQVRRKMIGSARGLQWRSPHSLRASRSGWSSRPAWVSRYSWRGWVLAGPSALDHAGQLQLAQPGGEHVARGPGCRRRCPGSGSGRGVARGRPSGRSGPRRSTACR
jgi:hypothetical protein